MIASPPEIPPVCFIDDVCRVFGISRRTLQRLRRHRVFPIPEMDRLDARPRWSGAKVQAFINGEPQLRIVGRRHRA